MEEPTPGEHRPSDIWLNDAPIGVFVSSLDGAILDVNDTVFDLMGYTREELKTMNAADFYDDPASRDRLIGELSASGLVRGFEVKTRHKDGSLRWSRLSVRLTSEGEPRLIGFVEDVTREVEAAEALGRLTQDLEQRNAELDAFAAVVAHDLKEPLRKITHFSKLLAGSIDTTTEDTTRYVERLESAAARMQTLIDELLTLSRVGRERSREKVDLTMAARAAATDLEAAVHQAGATVEIDDLPIIEAEPTQMHQLFLNLLSNSIKFGRDGTSPLVKISGLIREGQNGDRWCEISVVDNGRGFTPDQASKVFQPFERLAERGNLDGSGLGLAICQRIVEVHDGSIETTTTPGQGATFTIRLAQ